MQLSPIIKKFLNFVWNFRNLHNIWNTYKKKWALGVIFFFEIIDYKKGVTWMTAKRRIRTLMDNEQVKGPKHCINLESSIFVIFFDHFQRKSAQKILF